MERCPQIRPREEAAELIECYIRRHGLEPHDRLPSEREMCAAWNLNRTTLRNAIRRLTEEGKLYSQKGSGTYVAPPKLERNLQDTKSTTEVVRRAGSLIQTRLLDMELFDCTSYISHRLQIPEGKRVFYLRRLRIMDGVPYTIESSYINYELCPRIEDYDFADESLYRVLTYYNVYPTQGEEIIGITYATEEEARRLQIQPGDYLFSQSGLSKTPDGKPIEYFKSIVRADKVRFSTTLHRKSARTERGQAE